MSQIVKIETAVRKQSKGGKPFWAITSGADKYTLWENSWKGTQINVGATLHAEIEVSPDGKYKTLKPLRETPQNQTAVSNVPVISQFDELTRVMAQAVHELQIIREIAMELRVARRKSSDVLPPPRTDKDLALPEEVADDLF